MVKMGLISKSQARSRGFTFYFFMCMCVQIPMCHGAPMKAREQLVRLDSKCLSSKPFYLSRYLIFLYQLINSFVYMWAWKCVHACVQCACVWTGRGVCLVACRSQKRTSDTSELELQTFVGYLAYYIYMLRCNLCTFKGMLSPCSSG